MAAQQEPFLYEDSLESVIQSVVDRNNRLDPTGEANRRSIPPRRIQQQLRQPKWYNPDQHAAAPHLYATISAAPVHRPDAPYIVTVTLRHQENPNGNPDSRPVTLELSDTGLTSIGGSQGEMIYPGLLLRHDPEARSGGLKEVELEREGHGPAEMFDSSDDNADPDPVEVQPENGFVTLAVGETKRFEVRWQPPRSLLAAGARYRLCFRGIPVRWWIWGGMELMGDERKVEQTRTATEKLWIACTNSVEFQVEAP